MSNTAIVPFLNSLLPKEAKAAGLIALAKLLLSASC